MWQFYELLKPELDRTVHAKLVAKTVQSNPLAIFIFYFLFLYKNNLTQFYST